MINITCYLLLFSWKRTNKTSQMSKNKTLLSSSLSVKCPSQSCVNNQTAMQMAQSLPQTIIAFNQIEPCQNLIGNRSRHVKGYLCHCCSILEYRVGQLWKETFKSKFHGVVALIKWLHQFRLFCHRFKRWHPYIYCWFVL